MATKKKTGNNLNAPTKTVWLIALVALIVAAVLYVLGLTGAGWAGIAGTVIAFLSAALLLAATKLKGL